MIKRESTRVGMNETRRQPCCAGCAEFNAAGCPGGGPFCITREMAAAAASAELDRCADVVRAAGVSALKRSIEASGVRSAESVAIARATTDALLGLETMRRVLEQSVATVEQLVAVAS